jgi:hypothetical protein
MKIKLTSLQIVDLAIGIGFALMLMPLWIRLGNGKYNVSDHLGHFADVLGIIAALYAGRTAFFKGQQQLESETSVYVVMAYLLAGYGVIKCWAFINKGLEFSESAALTEYLLIGLMAAFVAPFSWLAFDKAIKEGKNVFFRVLFGVIAPVAFLIMLIRVLVNSFR